MQRTMLLGHSHADALADAASLPEVASRVEVVHPRHVKTHEAAWEWVAANLQPVTVICWMGNEHMITFMFEHEVPFELIDDRVPGAPRRGVAVLPQELLRHFFHGSLALLPRWVDLVKRLAGARVFLLGTPPPVAVTPAKLERLRNDEHFQKQVARLGYTVEDMKLSSLRLRCIMWHIVQDMRRDAAAQLACEFVPVPDMALTPRGTLRERYAGKDSTHANVAFGALMWNEVVKRLG